VKSPERGLEVFLSYKNSQLGGIYILEKGLDDGGSWSYGAPFAPRINAPPITPPK